MPPSNTSTYVIGAAVLLTVLYALHVLQNIQPQGVPQAAPVQAPQARDNSLNVLEPLVRSVKDELFRLESSVQGLNNNLNALASKVNVMEDQGALTAQRNRDLSNAFSGVEKTLAAVDGKIEKIASREHEVVIREVPGPTVTVSKGDDRYQQMLEQNKAIYENAKAIEDENYAKIKTNAGTKAHYRSTTFLHYLFEPIWNCPNKEKVPFVADDGAKYVCDTARYGRLGDDCIIYSIGVNNKAESMFDFDLATRFPNCKFFLFDPSLDARRHNELVSSLLPNMVFNDWGIAPTISSFSNGKALLPIDEIKKRLGHTGKRITALKIDTEGAEWLTLPAFMNSPEAQLVDEMQIEVHFYSTTFEVIIPFFEAIRNKGYAIYSKDVNGHCGTICMEYAWINLSLIE